MSERATRVEPAVRRVVVEGATLVRHRPRADIPCCCAEDEELCAATTRAGERCRRPPLAGQWLCAEHLAAPAVAALRPSEFRRRIDALRERLRLR